MDPKLSQSIANFALRFSNELENSKTTICSPLSVEIVLAMLALGCRNRSHDELMQALGIDDDETLRASITLLTTKLKYIEGATLIIANKIYLRKDDKIKPEIEKEIEEVFDSSLQQLDFAEKKSSADVINEWVAQRTNDLIKDIVSADMFDENTSIVLVNAIYFKGKWCAQFIKRLTENRDFHVNKTTTIKVPQMYQDSVYLNYGVSEKLKAKLLEMHYEGIQSSMVIVLPDEVDGLSSMLRQLTEGHDLMADINTLKWTKVDVMIPKFKTEMTINLKDLLAKLGIKSIFNENSSDINMLTSPNKQFVSQAIQKTFIEVNEAGTEAAAATRPLLKQLCLEEKPMFVADHPFLYLLLAHGIPIFVGTYYGQDCTSTESLDSSNQTQKIEPVRFNLLTSRKQKRSNNCTIN